MTKTAPRSTIAVLLGSLRQASLNRVIAESLAELVPEGVDVVLLPSVGDLPHYDQDIQDKGFPKAVEALADGIRQADAVVIVTPEYNYSVPGALKNAIDWLSRLKDQPFNDKPVAIQTASPGAIGGARAQYHLRQMLVFLNAQVLNKPEIMVGMAADKIKDGKLVDEKTRGFIKTQLEALLKAAQKA